MGYCETTKGQRFFDIVPERGVMCIEEVKNHNKSLMNDSHKYETQVHLISNEGSEVVQGQAGDSDHSETVEEIDSTDEQGERGSETSESEYREDLTVITKCNQMGN